MIGLALVAEAHAAPPPPAAAAGTTVSSSATNGAETNLLTLVRDGHPACLIVVPGPARLEESGLKSTLPDSPVAAEAARELSHYLEKISGAEIPVRREDTLTPAEREGTLVLVGEGELARECGVRVASLKPEGFVIKTAGRRLVLAGRDDPLGTRDHQRGTAFAVTAFLEDQLGVRWLWPGPLGEVAPPRRSVVLKPLDVSDAPRLRQRVMRDDLSNPRNAEARRRLGMDEQIVQMMQEESRTWRRRLRTGRSVSLNYHPGFTNWWENYYWQHPRYFAFQLDRSREWPPALGDYDRVKICVSSPQVLDQFMANAKEFFQKHPDFLSFSASPNDNAYSGHCLCRRCNGWDVKEATPVQLNSIDATGQRITFEHPALTDRYLHFYNLAAERLEKIAPGKFIAGYAYGPWFTPPVRETVRSNVLIAVVGFNHLVDPELAESRRAWDGWAKLTTNLVLRPNLLHFGHGYPLNYTHWLGETLRHCADTGMIGSYWDSLQHHWAAQGLNLYVLARLLWNPQANVEALINDYCQAGFGPAAPAVRAYFDGLEEHTQKLRARLPDRKAQFVTETLSLHTPDHFAALQKHLDRAKSLAAGDTNVLARVAFLEKGLTYARLQSEAVELIQKKDWQAAKLAVAAREQFYQDNLYSFAIGVASLTAQETAKRAVFSGNERAAGSSPLRN